MLVTDDDILDYLEHHGVKGMRWGVRRASGSGPSGGETRRKKLKKALTSDTAKKAYLVTAVVGAAAAHQILQSKRNTKMREARLAAYSRSRQFDIYNAIQDQSRGKGGAFKESFGDLKKMQKNRGWDDSQMGSYLFNRLMAVSKMPKR